MSAQRAAARALASSLSASLDGAPSSSAPSPNASLSPPRSAGLARAAQRLLRGQPVRVHVVGGSAAAGAGGAGVNATFDALLVAALNRAVGAAEPAAGRALGRFVRTSLSQGGTSSLWASLMGEALHGRPPHVLVWEYAINDHSLAVEAAATNAGSADATMRFMVERWLRRSLALRPPPALCLAYLWDKLPAAPFKPGNRALCRRMPVAGSAYDAQRPVLAHYLARGADLTAFSAAHDVNDRLGSRAFCPLIADSYFHPSAAGHRHVADALGALLLRQLVAELGRDDEGSAAAPTASAALHPAAPCAAADGGCALSDAVSALLADDSVRPTAHLAWMPRQAADDALPAPRLEPPSPLPPPLRCFAKSDPRRIDRKWTWIVPPCASNASLALALAPRGGGSWLRALSFYAMVSPGARLRHTLDGAPLTFERARGSVLERSWGYLAHWHLPPAPRRLGGGGAEWRMCAERVDGARCAGFRCGLEFKVPARTAAVGWMLALTSGGGGIR